MHEAIQIDQITDHSGLVVDGAADGDFDHVIVAVSVGIVALAVGRAVFFRRHGVAMQAMRGGKQVAAGQIAPSSYLSVEIDEKIGRFVDPHAMQCVALSFGARRCQMAMARFSVVGIWVRNSGTSLLRKRWSRASSTSRFITSFNYLRSTTKPDRGSTSPLTVTSSV